MFERAYAVYSVDWASRAEMDAEINAAVTERDHPKAAASVACMSVSGEQLHILIEYWRPIEDGDSEQDPAAAVDATAAVGKPRRARKGQNDDAGAAARVEPESVNLPLE